MKYLDLAGREINKGDWLVRSYNRGKCAALKFSYVLYTDKSLRLLSCVKYDWASGPDYECSEGTMKFPDRTFLISPSEIPSDILKAIGDYHDKKWGTDWVKD